MRFSSLWYTGVKSKTWSLNWVADVSDRLQQQIYSRNFIASHILFVQIMVLCIWSKSFLVPTVKLAINIITFINRKRFSVIRISWNKYPFLHYISEFHKCGFLFCDNIRLWLNRQLKMRETVEIILFKWKENLIILISLIYYMPSCCFYGQKSLKHKQKLAQVLDMHF